MNDSGNDAVDVLRDIWTADGQSSAEIEELQPTGKVCKNTAMLGIKGMEISLWYGLAGPAGLPQPIVQRLNAELGTILKTPEIREGFARQGAVATGGTPQDYANFMRDESARWGEVVRRNNIKIE